MSILTGPPPCTVEIDGQSWDIRTDFCTGVRFELLIQSREVPEEEKALRALELYYPVIPPDIPKAVEAMLWFYRCGKPEEGPRDGQDERQEARRRAYDFDQDAAYIYAAFRQCYGIDLSSETLHWWLFRALFLALPEDCRLCRMMHYRTAKLSGMDKAAKKRYEAMRKLYALKEPGGGEKLTLRQRDLQMRRYVAQRLEGGEASKKQR